MIGNQPTIVIKYCQLAAELVWTHVTLLSPWYVVAETKLLGTLVDSDARGPSGGPGRWSTPNQGPQWQQR